MQKVANGFGIILIAALAFGLWREHVELTKVRTANEKRIAELEDQILRLRQDAEKTQKTSTSQLTTPKEPSDLPQIRAAIAELRRRAEDLEKRPTASAPSTNAAPADSLVYPDSTLKKKYTFAGFTSTSAATESLLWAISKLDRKSFLSAMTPEEAKNWEQSFADLPPDIMPGGFRNGSMYRAIGFKITEETPVSDSEVKVKVFLEGQNQVLKMFLKKIGPDWKWAGNFQ